MGVVGCYLVGKCYVDLCFGVVGLGVEVIGVGCVVGEYFE